MLPETAWTELKKELKNLSQILQEREKEENDNQWLESEEVRKLLGISQKTWQIYRNERRIPFSQFGRKIYVRRGDIDNFLQSHMINK